MNKKIISHGDFKCLLIFNASVRSFKDVVSTSSAFKRGESWYMNHFCYLCWNSKSLAVFQNACPFFKGSMSGQTSHAKKMIPRNIVQRTLFHIGVKWKSQLLQGKKCTGSDIFPFGWHMSCLSTVSTFCLCWKCSVVQCQSSFDKLFHWCQFSWRYALSIRLWISNGCETPGVHTVNEMRQEDVSRTV